MLASPFDEVVILLSCAEGLLNKAIANHRGNLGLDVEDLVQLREVARHFRRQYSHDPTFVTNKVRLRLSTHRNFNSNNPHGLEAAAIAIALVIRLIEGEPDCAAMRFTLCQAVNVIESLAEPWGDASVAANAVIG